MYAEMKSVTVSQSRFKAFLGTILTPKKEHYPVSYKFEQEDCAGNKKLMKRRIAFQFGAHFSFEKNFEASS